MIASRLKEFIAYKGISVFGFEKSIGLANNTIRKKLASGHSNMGTDTLQLILKTYPELSADWLLLGIGEMLRKDNKEPEETGDPQLEIIKQQQQTISELTKALTTLIEKQSKL